MLNLLPNFAYAGHYFPVAEVPGNYNFPLLGGPTTSQFQIVNLASKNHYPNASQYYETANSIECYET
jgi:hypothetical protein